MGVWVVEITIRNILGKPVYQTFITYFENVRPLIMVVKRFITREETTVDRELQPHLA